MDIPSIRELFTPPETARIMKEQRIEAIDGNNWISGIIDRLILDDGTAVIVDFKTDHAESPEQLRERHSNQLNAYARIVSRITGIPLERITRIIVSTCLKETGSHPISLSFPGKSVSLYFPALHSNSGSSPVWERGTRKTGWNRNALPHRQEEEKRQIKNRSV